MKRIFILALVAVIGFAMPAAAQQYQEVVYLKNGSVIKGVVIEQIPGQSVKVQTQDGSIFVYEMSEVDKIVKEDLQQKRVKPATTIREKSPRPQKVSVQHNYQKNIFGIRAGMNLAKRGTGDFSTQNKIGYFAGVNYQRLLINNAPLYLETGVYFSMKGYKDNSSVDGMEAYSIEAEANPMYMQVPVLLNYKFNVVKNFTLAPYAGGYYALGVAGDYKETENGEQVGSSPLFTDEDGEGALMKRSDLGIIVGLNISWKKLSLNIGYEFGQVNNPGYNKCFTLGLGYNF